MFGKLFGKKDAEAAEDGEAKGKPKGKGKTKDKVEPEIEAPSAAQEGAPPLDGATPPAPAEGGESAPVNPDTAAAIEAARKASQAMDKPSLAFGSGKDDEPVIKKKKKDEDEESPEDEFQTQKKKLPVQPILQGAVTFVFLLIMGGMSGWILTRDPPPPLPGHLVEFEMPELGRGYAGQQGAPGVAAPPVDDYASLEPIDMNLLEDSAHGLVPKTSEDGKEPWAAYRRPFSNPDKKPRVGLVFVNMGLSRTALEAVVGKVPGAIALAFQPYGRETERGMDVARASGHETYIMVPFEPSEHPLADPGPHVLLTKLEAERNLDRLDWVLS
ncbi:MAG: hypothetical protein FJX47_14230, partial [Alphaproteobacteria bacterium]|nr:hypothetical protein [Alphaproteobacteria bacterium]